MTFENDGKSWKLSSRGNGYCVCPLSSMSFGTQTMIGKETAWMWWKRTTKIDIGYWSFGFVSLSFIPRNSWFNEIDSQLMFTIKPSGLFQAFQWAWHFGFPGRCSNDRNDHVGHTQGVHHVGTLNDLLQNCWPLFFYCYELMLGHIIRYVPINEHGLRVQQNHPFL